jgi:exosortase
MTPAAKQSEWHCPDWRSRLFGTFAFSVAIAILFRALLAGCMNRWMTEPQYSHGFAIPVMALGLGWFRREKFLPGTARSGLYGLALILFGIAGHVAAVYCYVEAIDAISFLLVAMGTTLLIWGRRAFWGLWPAILFLGFMLPLPFQIERALSGPLQILGANEAAWYIQTFGIPAIAQGNTILMGDTRLGVAEACSGLRMLLVFLAISTAAVIISRRMAWEKLLMLMSALPIALICNVARIVATALVHQSLGRATADLVFHDLSGWLMMPLAMLLLFLELKLLDYVFIQAGDTRPGVTYHSVPQSFTAQTSRL